MMTLILMLAWAFVIVVVCRAGTGAAEGRRAVMIGRTTADRRVQWQSQERYYGRALSLRADGVAPHSPHSCGCLACADLREYLGMAPLKTEFERRCGL